MKADLICASCGGPKKSPTARVCRTCHNDQIKGDEASVERYRRLRENRRVYTLEEIAAMHRRKSQDGYVYRTLMTGVSVGEHILVVESFLETRLPKGASVHHKNGIRDDNRFENLEVWMSTHKAGQRVMCPRCGWPDLETY